MDKKIISLWDKNKCKLKEYFTTTNQSEYDNYLKLVELIVAKILNNEDDCDDSNYDIDNITMIDDGNWQGTLIFLIPKKTYQPSVYEYLVTYVYYGTCPGCDILQSIYGYESGLPNEEQINDYMTLCLHLIQRMKPLYDI